MTAQSRMTGTTRPVSGRRQRRGAVRRDVFTVMSPTHRIIVDAHKRLMLLATVGGLMWPAITGMPYVAGRPILMFGLFGALVLASAARDILLRLRVHPVGLRGGLTILAVFPIRVAIGLTGSWHAFAAWLIRGN
jgi:hypothetical protein